jgi:hypothetical protein
VVRFLINDVTVTRTDQIHVHVRFRGGQTTSLNLPVCRGGCWKRRCGQIVLASGRGSGDGKAPLGTVPGQAAAHCGD